mgnify:CR=1 FL=1
MAIINNLKSVKGSLVGKILKYEVPHVRDTLQYFVIIDENSCQKLQPHLHPFDYKRLYKEVQEIMNERPKKWIAVRKTRGVVEYVLWSGVGETKREACEWWARHTFNDSHIEIYDASTTDIVDLFNNPQSYIVK